MVQCDLQNPKHKLLDKGLIGMNSIKKSRKHLHQRENVFMKGFNSQIVNLAYCWRIYMSRLPTDR